MTTITRAPFGAFGGRAVDLYTLAGDDGATVKIATYGGIVTSWTAPDRAGRPGRRRPRLRRPGRLHERRLL